MNIAISVFGFVVLTISVVSLLESWRVRADLNDAYDELNAAGQMFEIIGLEISNIQTRLGRLESMALAEAPTLEDEEILLLDEGVFDADSTGEQEEDDGN
jgi:hypothetical protein